MPIVVSGGFSVSFFLHSVSSQPLNDKEKKQNRKKRKRKTKAKKNNAQRGNCDTNIAADIIPNSVMNLNLAQIVIRC